MRTLICLITALTALTPVVASASVADVVHSIRSRGCGGRPGVAEALRASSGLDAVARQWSQGGRLKEALARTQYRVVNSASMHVEGELDTPALTAVLADHYCVQLLDRAFTELGVYRRGADVWMILATPFVAPAADEADTVRREVLHLVNEARARARNCGRRSYRAAPPLSASAALERAALAHAKDMARHRLFEHRGSDGSEPAQRVTTAGYAWRSVGENIAAGAADAQQVVQGWLDSPEHCANIMGLKFTEMGVAFASNPQSEAGIYWSQVFASPARR